MSKENETALQDENKDNKPARKTRVRVIFDGVLGHKGLRQGDVTDNEDYVALLKTKRGRTLVEEVQLKV